MQICSECNYEHPDTFVFCPVALDAINVEKQLEIAKHDSIDGFAVPIDKYEARTRIYWGQKCEIFSARERETGAQFAVKMFHRGLSKRASDLEAFANLLAAKMKLCENKDSPRFVNAGVNNYDRPYIVMDFLESPSLHDYIKHKGTLNIEQFDALFSSALKTLDRLHQQNIAHLALSSNHLVPKTDGTTALIDFEFARELSNKSDAMRKRDIQVQQHLDRRGLTPCESMQFASPQRILEENEVDCRSDLYALAGIMYKSIAGAAPISGPNLMKTMQMQLTEQPRPLLNVNPSLARWGLRRNKPDAYKELEKVLFKAMQKKAKDQFQNANDFLSAIKSAIC